MNISYIQFVAPSGLEYRIYNDHIDISAGSGVWKNINKTLEKNRRKRGEKHE